jgi:iron complex outermembrane recepter protein
MSSCQWFVVRENAPVVPHALSVAVLVVSATFTHVALAGSAAGESDLETVTVLGSVIKGGLPQDLPANSAGYSARELEQQVNVIDTSDIVKYSPDTMTRKRYIGDRNAIVETRTASVTTSAHSLVYVDGVLISNLLGNGYAYPSRWNMVMPEELSRVDFFFGPFSAEYSGNSIGTTVFMTTRMPDHFTVSGKMQAFQEHFDYLDHSESYDGHSESGLVADRTDWGLSWLIGANHLESHGHPMTYALLGAPATCSGTCAANSPVVSGGRTYLDPTNTLQTAIGGQSLDHSLQDTVKLKLGYDLTPTLHARYTLGGWSNKTFNAVQSWVTDAQGNPVTYSSTGDISLNGQYYALGTLFSQNKWRQQHWMQALSLNADSNGAFDWEADLSRYRITRDRQMSSVPQGTTVSGVKYYGQVTNNPYGDGWDVLDVRGHWHTRDGSHRVSMGYHFDRYLLDSDAFYSTTASDDSWQNATHGVQLKSAAQGRTQTQAVYVQDAWGLSDHWSTTLGLRGDQWRAYAGSNTAIVAGAVSTVDYAEKHLLKLSPKLSLEDAINDDWSARLSVGRAYRFPTVTELYQSISGPASLVVNNPDLRPENALTTELTLVRNLPDGVVRASVFAENLHDALYSQTTPIAGVGNKTVVSNIDKVRTRGIELAYQQTNVGISGLDITGNVTYAQPKTVSGSLNPAYNGKVFPGVPRWRATAVLTYRATPSTSFNAGARYSGKQSNTLDNSDVNEVTYTANSPYFVIDLRVLHEFSQHWKAAFGIDNALDRTYFAYHPMSQRTFHVELKYQL